MNSYERIYSLLLELTDKQIEDEEGEFKRVAHNKRRGVKKQRGSKTQKLASTEREMAAAKKGRETDWSGEAGHGIEDTTDAPDIKPGREGLRQAVKLLKKYGRDKPRRRRAYDQVVGHDKQGRKTTADASIIRSSGKGKKKRRELVAGNTRAMFGKALGKKIRAHVYRAPS
jgi:hypothetical protein